MATNGTDIKRIVEEKIDKTYSGFLNNTKFNDLLKESLFEAVERKYRNMAEERDYDALSSAIRTNQVFVPGSGNVVSLIGISDYLHLLSAKAKFEPVVVVRNNKLKVAGATNTQPIAITLSTGNSNLRNGDKISIAGVFGNSNANGTFYAKKLNPLKIELYTDEQLVNPTSGNGNYTGGGLISKLYYNYTTPLFPNEKISRYSDATLDEPKVERGNLALKFYPDNIACTEVTIDYIQKGIPLIDVTNSIIDLELIYPFEFLITICNIAAELFFERVKDFESYQVAAVETEKSK